jgi:hypothetical protein
VRQKGAREFSGDWIEYYFVVDKSKPLSTPTHKPATVDTMDLAPEEFQQLMKSLEQHNQKLYRSFKLRYPDEPKPGAKVVRLREIEDVPRIFEASMDWSPAEQEAAGIDRLEIMVPKPWPNQMPHPVPDKDQTGAPPGKFLITVDASEEFSGPVGPGWNEMILANIQATTDYVPSVTLDEFNELAEEFQPVSNQGNNG